MAQGWRLEQWDQTSVLAAEMHNAFLARASDALPPLEFHPYRRLRRPRPQVPKGDIRILKQLFVDRPIS